MNNLPIIIIGGEPNSIFSEILAKSFKYSKKNKPIILFISYKLFLEQLKKLNLECNHNLIKSNKIKNAKLFKNKINIFNVDYKFNKPFEKISKKSNEYISECFRFALNYIKKNKISGLINGPISKKFFLNDKFLGITEYLANKLKIKHKFAMLIYNEKISVSPITTHLPISMISNKLKKKLIIEKILLINNFFKYLNKKKPNIAVTGLNPHCENFISESEEENIIQPALRFLIKKKLNIIGPVAADTIFVKENLQNTNVVVGMYHDQVLAPIKALTGFNAINITLGLPFLRLSPDHGPNQNMLGKNKSNYKSILLAINFLNKI